VKPLAYDLFLALEEFAKMDSQELNKMGRRGSEWIKNNYSIDIVNHKIEKLYAWLINGGVVPTFVIQGSECE